MVYNWPGMYFIVITIPECTVNLGFRVLKKQYDMVAVRAGCGKSEIRIAVDMSHHCRFLLPVIFIILNDTTNGDVRLVIKYIAELTEKKDQRTYSESIHKYRTPNFLVKITAS